MQEPVEPAVHQSQSCRYERNEIVAVARSTGDGERALSRGRVDLGIDDIAAAMREFTVTLPDDLAELVRQKVDSGQYENESAVMRAALWALEHDVAPDQGPGIEEWLRAEVVPTYDAVEADPGRCSPPSRSRPIWRLATSSCSKNAAADAGRLRRPGGYGP